MTRPTEKSSRSTFSRNLKRTMKDLEYIKTSLDYIDNNSLDIMMIEELEEYVPFSIPEISSMNDE